MSFNVPSFCQLAVTSIGSVILCCFQNSEGDNFKSFLFNLFNSEYQIKINSDKQKIDIFRLQAVQSSGNAFSQPQGTGFSLWMTPC